MEDSINTELDNYLFEHVLDDLEKNDPLGPNDFHKFYRICRDEGYFVTEKDFERYLLYLENVTGEA